MHATFMALQEGEAVRRGGDRATDRFDHWRVGRLSNRIFNPLKDRIKRIGDEDVSRRPIDKP